MPALVSNLQQELDEAKDIFLKQEQKLKESGRPQIDRNMPPVAGQLRFAKELRLKIASGVKDFKGLNHPICYSAGAQTVIDKYKEMVCLITSFEENAFTNWTKERFNYHVMEDLLTVDLNGARSS